MARIDIQGLIDQVLSMAQESQEERKKKQYRDTVNREYQEATGTTPELNLAKENNAGQLARQQLQQDFTNKQNIRTYNLDLFKARSADNTNRFNAQTLRQATMDKSRVGNLAGSKEDPRLALFTALSQLGVTDEEAVRIKKMYDSIYGGGQPTAQRAPAGEQRNIQPPDATRKGIYFTKDAPAQPGASSMEFASDEVLKKRKLAVRNKKVEEDMFGKPKRSSLFNWNLTKTAW